MTTVGESDRFDPVEQDAFDAAAAVFAVAAAEARGEAATAYLELTEHGIAQAFADRYSGRFLYDCSRGRWYVWDGSRWAEDATGRHFELLRQLAREASEAVPAGQRRTARKAATVAGAERFARTDPVFSRSGEGWDKDTLLLACPGATVDLRAGRATAPDPAHEITKLAAVAPREGACPRWHRFLLQVTGGDEELVRFLQVWVGYLLTGETREHKLVFIYGPGGNGKSVFANVVSRLLGDYAVSAAMDTFVAARGERHPTDLAMLRGARLVVASETEEGRAWAESRIKAITGGDPITARFMRGDFFTFQPAFKLMLIGNHQPVLRNVDAAVRRRFLILPMTRTPERPDPDLEAKLWEEAPEIFAWAIRGAQEWLEEGLPLPDAIAAATTEYFDEQDLFGAWFDQCCAVGRAADFETASALFASWRMFAENAGERPGTAKGLGARLRKMGLTNGPQRVNGETVKVWRGVRLRGSMQ
ncbi:MAG: putative DNA primase/helicase [Rhodobacteraceae bacterium HLUCCO18]|nr:MAG: putative DNA primase/helicase [Rhodobacteraceae bacterium HLUCCO18]